MRDRLLLIKDLLAQDGSVWVHLDDVEQHRMRCLMDEIFGAQNFITTVVWEKDQGRRNDTAISSAHDYLAVYARDASTWKRQRNLLPRTAEQESRYRNPDDDPAVRGCRATTGRPAPATKRLPTRSRRRRVAWSFRPRATTGGSLGTR